MRIGQLACLAVMCIACGQETRGTQAVERLEHATRPHDLAVAHELFDNATDQDVAQLMQHQSSRVALAAAWERVRRTVPDPKLVRGAKPDAQTLQRFLGFLEGRLQVDAPEAWERLLLTATTHGQVHICFAPLDAEQQAGPNNDAVVSEANEGWRIKAGGRAWLLAKSDVDEKKTSIDGFAAAATMDAVVVGLFGNSAAPFLIYSIEPKTGNVAWKQEVWASGGLIGGGVGWHQAQIVLDEDRCIIFGVSNLAAYVEVFKLDGTELCRFSTFNSTFRKQ